MVAIVYYPYIDEEYQEVIIDGLIKFYAQGLKISNDFLILTAIDIALNRILQSVFTVVLQASVRTHESGDIFVISL